MQGKQSIPRKPKPGPISSCAFASLEPLEPRQLLSSTLSGTVFADANGDGVQDPGELGLADRVVFLDTDNDGRLSQSEQSLLTNTDGDYTFTGLNAGTYNVATVNIAGWMPTTGTSSQTLNFVLPIDDPRDLIFDADRQLLYITTPYGKIERFHLPTLTMYTPFEVGAFLNGADMTADGAFLYVAEGISNATQGIVRKVNLDTGEVTNLTYDRANDDGTWDIAIGSHDKALFTTRFIGAGFTPLRSIDLTDDTITDPPHLPTVVGATSIQRGANRDTIVYSQPLSPATSTTYDAPSDAIAGNLPFTLNAGGQMNAVNRDGTLVAINGATLVVFDKQLNELHSLPDLRAGHIFDPTADILYAFDETTDELVAVDTTSFNELSRVSVGDDLRFARQLDDGVTAISDDGSVIFRNTEDDDGVRIITTRPTPIITGTMIAVGTDTNVADVHIGSQQQEIATIRGQLWQDNNENGTIEDSEQFTAGRTVYLDLNKNGQRDAGEPHQVTDSEGRYSFPIAPAPPQNPLEFKIDINGGGGPTEPGFTGLNLPASGNDANDVSVTVDGVTFTTDSADGSRNRASGGTLVTQDFIFDNGSRAESMIKVKGLPDGIWIAEVFAFDADAPIGAQIIGIDQLGGGPDLIFTTNFQPDEFVPFTFTFDSSGLPDEFAIFTGENSGNNRSRLNGLVLRQSGNGSTTVAIDLDEGPWIATSPNIYSGAVSNSLLPVTNSSELIYDSSRNRVYMPTTAGTVEIFDIDSQTMLTPVNTGGRSSGADISLDNQFLYVADAQVDANDRSFVYKVDLDTFAVTTIQVNSSGHDDGIADIEISANDQGVITLFSIFPLMRFLDTTDDSITSGVEISTGTFLSGGTDGSLVFFTNAASSAGQIRTWDPFTGEFLRTYNTNSRPTTSRVNSDASLIALDILDGVSIMDANLNALEVFQNIRGGFVFDTSSNVLYAADDDTNELVVLDPLRRHEYARVPIGESIREGSVVGTGRMVASDDGRFVFLATDSGVRVFDLGVPIRASSRTFQLSDGEQMNRIDFGMRPDVVPPEASETNPNGDEDQRSMLTNLTYQFTEQVTIDPDALSLFNLTANSAVNPAFFSFTYDSVLQRAIWSFPGLPGGSLEDGIYVATLDGSLITDMAGNAIDGDGDGQPGGDHVFNLHRLFGDADGDLDVDLADLFPFRAAFGTVKGDAQYRSDFDINIDDAIEIADLFPFRSNFGTMLPPSAPLQAPLQGESSGSSNDNLALLATWQPSTSPAADASDAVAPWLEETDPILTWNLDQPVE